MSHKTRPSIFFFLSLFYSGIAQIDLHYAYFTAGPEGGFDSSGSVPAVEIAEEQILRSGTILNGYKLRHTAVQDTQCNRTKSLDLFLSQIPFMKPPVLGLLGCGCSVASEPVAEIVHHWNISQIAYGSSSITLSESRFKNFFRTHPSIVNVVSAISSVIQYYGWKKVAFLSESETLFTGIFEDAKALLGKQGITLQNLVVQRFPLLDELTNSTKDFFFEEEEYRIFLINTYSDVAVDIICQAYKRSLTYPRYLWLTYGWYQERWWTSEVNGLQVNCSNDQLSEFLDRSLALQIFPTASDPYEMTDTEFSTAEFVATYVKRLQTSNAQLKNYSYTFTAALAYDATWALAVALNKTTAMVNFTGEEIFSVTGCKDDNTSSNQMVPLEMFTYDNGLLGCVISYHLKRTNFKGVSGGVVFDETGSRIQSRIKLLQYRQVQDSNNNAIGVRRFEIGFSTGSFFAYYNNESNDTVFPDGIPPDGCPIQVTVTYHILFVIIFNLLAGAGIVFTTVCFAFNFVFRKKKVVLLTSPKLNYFIIVGAYMIYITTIVRIVPSVDEVFVSLKCNLDSFFITVGYCLGFSTLLAKMFRLYQIFHKPCQKEKNLLRDWQLIIVILIVSGIGAVLALIGASVPQLQSVPKLGPNKENQFGENELGVRIEYQMWRCYNSANPQQNAFFYVRLSYLALLQIIGLVLAIQTRKVTVKVMNDSKYIAALIYIFSITLVVLALVTITLSDYLHIKEVFITGSLILSITAFLCLLFIPKMVSLYHDPSGKKIFHMGNQHSINIESVFSVIDERDAKISQLEARLLELESSRGESSIVMLSPRLEEESTHNEHAQMNNVIHTAMPCTCAGSYVKKPQQNDTYSKETSVL